MGLIASILRYFFKLLYHPLAWSYDLVAATVSLGRWKDWGQTVIPFLNGTRILELGHGPGHLQRSLRDLGLFAVGLDESSQMGRLANRNLHRIGYTQTDLTRGLAQQLPFPTSSFESIVSTFPAEYIFEPQTLAEVRRVLHPGGHFVVLPVAWLTGRNLLERGLAWLFQITGEGSPAIAEYIQPRMQDLLNQAGFEAKFEILEVESSQVLIIIAYKQQ